MGNYERFKIWLENGEISPEAFEYLSGKAKKILVPSKKYNEKKISITISTYNRSKLLLRLMDTILMQAYSNYEIIVIDDKSMDDTSDIVKDYIAKHSTIDIRYYMNEQNLGVSESKKRGYECCTGDIIIFSDDDDYYIDNLYFSKLNKIYCEHENCIMTTASTLYHYEQDDTYLIRKLNFDRSVDNADYLNGFLSEYNKPGSVFALSLNARKMREINYIDLKCFNDMSLYLYGALAKGGIYPIKEAVGVYSVQIHSMTSGVGAAFIINNLDAKIDIGKKAIDCGYLKRENLNIWSYQQCIPTLLFFYRGKIKIRGDYSTVNKWAWRNLDFPWNCKAISYGIKARIKYHVARFKNKYKV